MAHPENDTRSRMMGGGLGTACAAVVFETHSALAAAVRDGLVRHSFLLWKKK
jgi:hypothetical protein